MWDEAELQLSDQMWGTHLFSKINRNRKLKSFLKVSFKSGVLPGLTSLYTYAIKHKMTGLGIVNIKSVTVELNSTNTEMAALLF